MQRQGGVEYHITVHIHISHTHKHISNNTLRTFTNKQQEKAHLPMGSSEGPVCTGGGRTRGAAGRSGAYMLCRRSSLPLRSMPPKEIQRSGNYYNTHTILCREKQTNVNQYNQMLINIIHTILCVRYIYACFACARACAVEEINSIHACE